MKRVWRLILAVSIGVGMLLGSGVAQASDGCGAGYYCAGSKSVNVGYCEIRGGKCDVKANRITRPCNLDGCLGTATMATCRSNNSCGSRAEVFSCCEQEASCTVTRWSAWSACSVSCGGGTQTRTSNCGDVDKRSCNTQDCCTVSSWSACSVPCGGGTQTSNCGTTRACNTQTCTITGTVYHDPNNTCSTASSMNVGGSLTTILKGTAYQASVNSGGSYSLSAPAGTYTQLNLEGTPTGYHCSTFFVIQPKMR